MFKHIKPGTLAIVMGSSGDKEKELMEWAWNDLDQVVQADQAMNTCHCDGFQRGQGEGADGTGMELGIWQSSRANGNSFQLPRVVSSCAMQPRSHVPLGCGGI